MQYLSSDSILQGGRYQIVKMLGEGGFGITYLGIQTVLERQIVVKEKFINFTLKLESQQISLGQICFEHYLVYCVR